MSASEAAEIISGFILDAPPGELVDVLQDIKSLTSDIPSITNKIVPAVEEYNKEQFIAVTLPDGSRKVIVSAFNELEPGRFFDVESASQFKFDHSAQEASNVQPYALESKNSDLIKSVLKFLSSHVSEHFPSIPASGVFPTASDSSIAIVIVGNKYSSANYWNGRWRSSYTYDPASGVLSGAIKVDVHYYEDGNVRLLTNKSVNVSLPSASGADIVKSIAMEEKKYQEDLNRAFGHLSEGAFKSLRRQLPITRQKIDWDKIGSYRLGQDIGGARGGR